MRTGAALIGALLGGILAQTPARTASNGDGAQVAGCSTGIAAGDTARFTGVIGQSPWSTSRAVPQPPGSLTLWTDRDGRLHYREAWASDTVTYLWDGGIGFANGLPHSFSARRTRSGVIRATERIEHDGDSVVVVRNNQRTTERLGSGVVRVPGLVSTPVLAVLTQCAAGRSQRAFSSSAYGEVRLRELDTISLTAASRRQRATLYLLSSDSVAQLAVVWLEPQSHRLVAMRGADGGMDVVASGWEAALEQLARAEARASRPSTAPESCAGGVGVGGCTPTMELHPACGRIPSTPARVGGAFTISDSGYSVTTDGLGPYRGANTQVVTGPGAILLLRSSRSPRSFTIDLNRPVPGDIGHPLGKIKVDGVWPGSFIPAGADYANELSAFHFSPDSTTLGTDIPVGSTVDVGVGLLFYLNGATHAVWAGPEHFTFNHCLAAGTLGAYSSGTTPAKLSRPTPTTWVVDLPPGSIARLFGHHAYRAVNEGLYFVSLHFTIQQ